MTQKAEEILLKLATPNIQEILKEEKEEYHEEEHFPSGRKGSDHLKAAMYVEDQDNKSHIEEMRNGEKPIFGYFCQTCKYMIEKKGAAEGTWCEKLQAEDAPWGCCNIWEKK